MEHVLIGIPGKRKTDGKREEMPRFASEAAFEMEFQSEDELCEAVRRAMELCLSAGLPLKGNFRRICKSSSNGIEYDWKLSELAFGMVRLNGQSTNPVVARNFIRMIGGKREALI